jgi:hypothetical protein
MAKPQGTAIENQLHGFRIVELFTPINLFVAVHGFTS